MHVTDVDDEINITLYQLNFVKAKVIYALIIHSRLASLVAWMVMYDLVMYVINISWTGKYHSFVGAER